MDSIIGDLLLAQLRRYESDHLEKIKLTRDGHIELITRRSCGEGTCLLKPAGKNLSVSVTNLTYRQPIEHISKDLPRYFHIALCRGTMRGIGGAHIEKGGIYRQRRPAGFSHCGVGVSFLSEFFDTFIGSRYHISPDELIQAIDALRGFPLIPEAVIILKQIGEASFTGDIGNVWIEAKTLELISVIMDWHRRPKTGARPPLDEQDQAGIAAALRYAGERFSRPLPLEALAKQAAMSTSKFTALFKRHTGLSAACYIHRLRMEKAMNAVKNTSCPLGEVAGAVGYKHYTSFSTAFREHFGVAPSEFRKGQ
ncbi:MAG: AraC family transcriptional regulator [Treponema sp.]|nr:AraC family transcriptional regulator [Treponema sp.]